MLILHLCLKYQGGFYFKLKFFSKKFLTADKDGVRVGLIGVFGNK
jgi:hypothetical protein